MSQQDGNNINDEKIVNYVSQIHLRLKQISDAPMEDRRELVKKLENFMLQINCGPSTYENIRREYIDKIPFGKHQKADNHFSNLNRSIKTHSVDYSSSFLSSLKKVFTKSSSLDQSNIPCRTYNVEMIPKIYGSILIQLKIVIDYLKTLLSTIQSKRAKSTVSMENLNIQHTNLTKNYLVGDALKQFSKSQHVPESSLDFKEKCLNLYENIIYNLAPILEAVFHTGLSIKSRKAAIFYTHPWNLLERYFNSTQGNLLLKQPMVRIFDTYGPEIIENVQNFQDRDTIIYVISKIVHSNPEDSLNDKFFKFILEGVVRGRLSFWIETLIFQWPELLTYYSEASFVRNVGVEEISVYLSKLNGLVIDPDEDFHDIYYY